MGIGELFEFEKTGRFDPEPRMTHIPKQRVHFEEDEPGKALCCGAAIIGDIISGYPCPACGQPLPYVCRNCGEKATCYGTYEGFDGFSCDECCGHGNEDGHCEMLRQ